MGTVFCGVDVPALLAEYDVPGCSVAVLDGGEIVARRAFGVRSTDGRDVAPDTLFQACSLSKPVTLLGVLRLVEQGGLDLDADVNERLIGWRVPPNGGWQPRVTLRQLACHTAGVTTSGFPGYAAGATVPTLLQILTGAAPANSPGVRVEGLPGFRFRYSGGGTTVIHLLLESVTGTPAGELLTSLVLIPLGMVDSTFAQPLPAPYAGRAAHGHRGDGTPVPGGWHTYPEQCAAGLWTTPADLLRYARGVQEARGGAPGALMSPGAAAQMLRPHVTLPPGGEGLGGLGHVGLGPYLRTAEGGSEADWFGHAGGNEGYRCHLLASVRTGQGAAVMTNGDAGSAVIGRLLPAIAEAYGWQGLAFGPPYRPVPTGAGAGGAGRYETASGLRVELVVGPGGPFAVVDGQPAMRLCAVSPTELVAEELDLLIRVDGPDRITLEQDGHAVPCRRVAVG